MSGEVPLTSTEIPRTIHYCMYGPRPMDEVSSACMDSWKRILPGYEISRWDESRGLGASPYAKAALAARKYAFVADYMRCYALYHQGGVYLDTDVEMVRPFDPLLGDTMFLGHETPSLIGTAIIGARAGHPLLKKIMDHLDSEARAGKMSYSPGPELITRELNVADQYLVSIYPEEYFYPYNPHTNNSVRKKPLLSNMTENTYCVHQWEGSWVSDASLRMLIGLRISHAIRGVRKSLVGASP